ncbi:hypothetical protein, conserved [Leishmania lindenbergi]|uniref:Uncharacterized protein n=1 Tax=Leishmania lindenbergi TaxID=651832 RepID=A0AAW3AIN4_9TRYP
MTAAPLLRYQRIAMQKGLGNVTTPTSTTYRWSGASVCALTKADMLFYTTQSLLNSPPPQVSYRHTYTSSPLQGLAHQSTDLLGLPYFAGNYAARNQCVVLRPYVEVGGGLDVLRNDGNVVRGLWEDLDDLNPFIWYVQLRILLAEVHYCAILRRSVQVWLDSALCYRLRYPLAPVEVAHGTGKDGSDKLASSL